MTADFRHAVRALRATPLFTSVTILTLALGIGATSAIFSLINGVLLKPLPFRDPSRLVIGQTAIPEIGDRYPVVPVNAREFAAWREHCRATCDELAAMSDVSQALTGNGPPESLVGARTTANVFSVLGIAPALGRSFVPGDELPGGDAVVVLTHPLWQRRFGADRGIVGRRITLDGRPYEVIGVLPPEAVMPPLEHLYPIRGKSGQPAYFTPLTFTAEELQNEGDFDHIVIIRLRGDATPQQAAHELTPITEAAFRGTGLHPTPIVRPLEEQVVSNVRRALWFLLAAALAAFVVGCVNLANLLTSRWLGRRREIAIRTAMGAGPRDLARHAVVETSCLAIAGGLLGLPVAYTLVRGLLALAPVDIPRLDQVGIDAGVLAFAGLLMLGCSLACSILPVWRVWRTDPADVLKAGAHTTTDAPGWSRVRSALVGGEVGLATALLMLAGLLVASFVGVLTVDPGFQPERLTAVTFRLSDTRYPKLPDRVRFVERLLAETETLGAIESAAIVQKLPLEGEATVDAFITDVALPREVLLKSLGNHYFVSPGYFSTMGIEIVRGRVFDDRDRTRRVALVSEHTARTLWPGEEAIGKSFWRSNRQNRWEVIGIVADTRSSGLDEAAGLTAYVPFWERTAADLSLVVRSRSEAEAVVADLRGAVRRIDAELPLSDVRTAEAIVDRTLAGRRFQMVLTLAFAAAGLLIACLGIYAVVASAVERRRSELAIRIALGGSPRRVALLVAGQGLRPVFIGLVLGTIAAVGFGSVLRAMLFGVSPTEPSVLAGVATLVLAVGVLACLGPALRAVRAPLLTALRDS